MLYWECVGLLASPHFCSAHASTAIPHYPTVPYCRVHTVPPRLLLVILRHAGESVANLADVVGTAFGIALAKANLPVLPTFVALSIGYLAASR